MQLYGLSIVEDEVTYKPVRVVKDGFDSICILRLTLVVLGAWRSL